MEDAAYCALGITTGDAVRLAGFVFEFQPLESMR